MFRKFRYSNTYTFYNYYYYFYINIYENISNNFNTSHFSQKTKNLPKTKAQLGLWSLATGWEPRWHNKCLTFSSNSGSGKNTLVYCRWPTNKGPYTRVNSLTNKTPVNVVPPENSVFAFGKVHFETVFNSFVSFAQTNRIHSAYRKYSLNRLKYRAVLKYMPSNSHFKVWCVNNVNILYLPV